MEINNYSKSIAQIIEKFLTDDDWHFCFDAQRGRFWFNLHIENLLKKVNYSIIVNNDSYILYANSPIAADASDGKMMAAMTNFICRANYGLTGGNFEIDISDGAIRYKYFVDCEDITPSAKMVKNSIYSSAMVFQRYGEGITDIVFRNASALDAYRMCEMSFAEIMGDAFPSNEENNNDSEEYLRGLLDRIEKGERLLSSLEEEEESNEGDAAVSADLFDTEEEE